MVDDNKKVECPYIKSGVAIKERWSVVYCRVGTCPHGDYLGESAPEWAVRSEERPEGRLCKTGGLVDEKLLVD